MDRRLWFCGRTRWSDSTPHKLQTPMSRFSCSNWRQDWTQPHTIWNRLPNSTCTRYFSVISRIDHRRPFIGLKVVSRISRCWVIKEVLALLALAFRSVQHNHLTQINEPAFPFWFTLSFSFVFPYYYFFSFRSTISSTTEMARQAPSFNARRLLNLLFAVTFALPLTMARPHQIVQKRDIFSDIVSLRQYHYLRVSTADKYLG
jgi:hypothetical protein